MPFNTKTFVTVPKGKRNQLTKKGMSAHRAEVGRIVGYQSIWSNVPKVLLDENRMIHSRHVSYDVMDYGQPNPDRIVSIDPKDTPDPMKAKLDDFLENLRAVETDTFHDSNRAERDKIQGNPLYSPEGGAHPDVSTGADPEDTPEPHSPRLSDCADLTVDIETFNTPPPPEFGRGHTRRRPTEHYKPGDDTMESRQQFLAAMDQLQKIDHELEVYSIKVAKAVESISATDPAAVQWVGINSRVW